MVLRTKEFFFLVALFLMLSGCDKVVSDFVDGAKRDGGSTTTTTPPSVSNSSPMSFKITPGKLNSATSTSGAIRGTVTATNKTLTLGSDMAMSVTISRVRLVPQ